MFWYARKNSALWCRDQQRNTANVGMGLNSSTPKHVHYYWSGYLPPARCREQRCCHHQPSHSHYLEVTWQVVAVKPNKVSPRLNVQLQVHVLSPRRRPAPPRPRPHTGRPGLIRAAGAGTLVAICRSSLPVLAPRKVVLSTSPLTRLCRAQL